MANNCLVTKLKDSVNNQNLKKLGVLRMPIAPTSEATATFIKHYAGLKPCVVTVYHSDGTVSKTFNSSPSDAATDFVYINLPNGGYAEITNKYNLYSYNNIYAPAFNYQDIDLELYPKVDEFMYCEHLTTISTRDYFVNYAKLPSTLETISYGAYQLGDIIDYVNAMRTKGINSKTIACAMNYQASPHIAATSKFNGVTIQAATFSTGAKKDVISWDADKAFVRVENGTVYYTCGYTDEQIATLTATGGDWEGATVHKTD